MNKYFEKLMKTPCEVLGVVETVNPDGVRVKSYSIEWSGNCNFHSINIKDSEFADKVGNKTLYIVCLPLDVSINYLNKIKINNKVYTIIGIRDATLRFENICEVVLYE